MDFKLFSYKRANTTPRKANNLIKLVKNKNSSEALRNLQQSDKKASKMWEKLIKSALGFYKEKGIEDPFIREAYTSQANIIKRGRFIGRSNYNPIRKIKSNLFIKLEGKIEDGK
ncbi:uL22 family ribosomal protein [Patescibacteria group bacterium]|nr:uL22 family ribosomal protein [Patescibacteria group bacterium]